MVNTEIRLIIFFAAKDGEALYNQQKQDPGADCGSDHELLIAKFRLKLKKVRKTIRWFRYDLNQIPYDYSVEVTNWFKGLDLMTECLKNYGLGPRHCTGDRDQVPMKKKYKKGKRLSEEALQIDKKRKETEGKGIKERYSHLNAVFWRIAKRDKKAFLRD